MGSTVPIIALLGDISGSGSPSPSRHLNGKDCIGGGIIDDLQFSSVEQTNEWEDSLAKDEDADEEEGAMKTTTSIENAFDSEPKPDLYSLLITEAPYLPGDEGGSILVEEIPWVDKSLLEHGVSFYRRNFTFTILANTFALMIGFCVKPNSAVIMRTGKLQDPELSFQRYLSTIQRIGKFFLFSMGQETKSYAAFDTVRKMHRLASKTGKRDMNMTPSLSSLENLNVEAEPWKTEVAEAMRKDLEYIDTSEAPKHLLTWDPPVPVSQFDMVMTQYGFIGTMWLFPKVFGIKDRDEELKGVIHVWAMFGRLLGIRDEFNVCIKQDPELYDKIFRNIIVESLKTMDETVVTIQSAFMQAFNRRVPFMTYKAMLVFGLHDLEGYKGDNLWSIMSWTDKLSYKILQVWFWGMRNSVIYKILNHVVCGMWLQIQFWLHLPTNLWD